MPRSETFEAAIGCRADGGLVMGYRACDGAAMSSYAHAGATGCRASF